MNSLLMSHIGTEFKNVACSSVTRSSGVNENYLTVSDSTVCSSQSCSNPSLVTPDSVTSSSGVCLNQLIAASPKRYLNPGFIQPLTWFNTYSCETVFSEDHKVSETPPIDNSSSDVTVSPGQLMSFTKWANSTLNPYYNKKHELSLFSYSEFAHRYNLSCDKIAYHFCDLTEQFDHETWMLFMDHVINSEHDQKNTREDISQLEIYKTFRKSSDKQKLNKTVSRKKAPSLPSSTPITEPSFQSANEADSFNTRDLRRNRAPTNLVYTSLLSEEEVAYLNINTSVRGEDLRNTHLNLSDPVQAWDELLPYLKNFNKKANRGLYYQPDSYLSIFFHGSYDPTLNLGTNLYANFLDLLENDKLYPYLSVSELIAFVNMIYTRIYALLIRDEVIPAPDPEFQSGVLLPLVSEDEKVGATSFFSWKVFTTFFSIAAVTAAANSISLIIEKKAAEERTLFTELSEYFGDFSYKAKSIFTICTQKRTRKGHLSIARTLSTMFTKFFDDIHPELVPIYRVLAVIYLAYRTDNPVQLLSFLTIVDPAIIDYVQDIVADLYRIVLELWNRGKKALNIGHDMTPVFQSPLKEPSLIDGLTNIVVQLLGFGTVSSGYMSACVKTVTRFVTLITAGKSLYTIFVSVKDYLLDAYMEIVVYLTLRHDPTYIPIELARKEMLELLTAVMNHSNPDEMTLEEATKALGNRSTLVNFITCNYLDTKFTSYIKDLKTIVSDYDRKLQRSNINKVTGNVPMNAPMVVFLVGKPECGKSVLVDSLSEQWYDAKMETGMHTSKAYGPSFNSSLVWRKPHGDNFGDSYKSQPIVMMDDMYSNGLPAVVTANQSFLINHVQPFVTSLCAANPEEKGNKLFSPELILLTANSHHSQVSSYITCLAALERRMSVYVEVLKGRSIDSNRYRIWFDRTDPNHNSADYTKSFILNRQKFFVYMRTVTKIHAQIPPPTPKSFEEKIIITNEMDPLGFFQLHAYSKRHLHKYEFELEIEHMDPFVKDIYLKIRTIRQTHLGTQLQCDNPSESTFISDAEFEESELTAESDLDLDTPSLNTHQEAFSYLIPSIRRNISSLPSLEQFSFNWDKVGVISGIVAGLATFSVAAYFLKDYMSNEESSIVELQAFKQKKTDDYDDPPHEEVRYKYQTKKMKYPLDDYHSDFQSATSPGIPSSYKSVILNTVSISLPHSTILYHGIALDSMTIMIPRHYVIHFALRPDFILHYKTSKKTEISMSLEGKYYTIQCHPNKDMALITLVYSTADKKQYPQIRSIQHLFAQQPSDGGDLLRLVRYLTDKDTFEDLRPSGFTTKLIRDRSTEKTPEKLTEYIEITGLLVDKIGHSGYCGYPVLYGKKDSNKGHIYGFHIAADERKRSIVLPVILEDFDICRSQPYIFSDSSDNVYVARHQSKKTLPKGDYKLTGLSSQPFENILVPSDSSNLEKAEKAKSAQRFKFPLISEPALRFAKKVLSERLNLRKVTKCLPEDLLENSQHSNKLNLDASSGLSHCNPFRHNFTKTKVGMVHYPLGFDQQPEFLPNFLSEISHIDCHYSEPVSETTKVETQTTASYAKGKVRLFCVGGANSTIYGNTFMRPFSEMLQEQAPRSPVSVGINPYSYDWTELIYYLREGISDPVFLAGDKSQYDSCVPPIVTIAAADIISSCFPIEQQDDVHSLVTSLAYSLRIVAGQWYPKNGGNISGGSGTAVVNSITNGLLFWICFYNLFKEEGKDPFLYQHLVNAVAYGDDDLQCVDRSITDTINMKSLQRQLSYLGVTYTAPDKSDNIPLFYNIDQVSYLKHGFSFQSGLYYPTYPIELIFQLGTWYDANCNLPLTLYLEQLYQVCLNRLACYPKSTYDKYKYFLDKNYSSMGLTIKSEFSYQDLRIGFCSPERDAISLPCFQSGEQEDNNLQVDTMVAALQPISRTPYPNPSADGILNKEFLILSGTWTKTTSPFSPKSIKELLTLNKVIKTLLDVYRYRQLSYEIRVALSGDPSISGSMIIGYIPHVAQDAASSAALTFLHHSEIQWLDHTIQVNGNSRLPTIWTIPVSIANDYSYDHSDIGMGALVGNIITPLESSNDPNPSLQFSMYMTITSASLTGSHYPEFQGPIDRDPDPETQKNSSGILTSIGKGTHRFLSAADGTVLESALQTPKALVGILTELANGLGLQKTINITTPQRNIPSEMSLFGNPRGIITAESALLNNDSTASTDPALYGDYFNTSSKTLIDLACKLGHWETMIIDSKTPPGKVLRLSVAPSVMCSKISDITYLPTPFAYSTSRCLYWRGSTRLVVKYSSSNFITTNIQISYSPLVDTSSIVSQPGNYPTKIYSLTGTGEFEIVFPYLHSRQMIFPTTSAGFINIAVLNPPGLIHELDSKMTLQIYVSATPDLQMFGPTTSVLQEPIVPGASTVPVIPNISSSLLATFSDLTLIPRIFVPPKIGELSYELPKISEVFLAHRGSGIVTLTNAQTSESTTTIPFLTYLSGRPSLVPIIWDTLRNGLINIRLPRSSVSNYDVFTNRFPVPSRTSPRDTRVTYSSTQLTTFTPWMQDCEDSSHGILIPPPTVTKLPNPTAE